MQARPELTTPRVYADTAGLVLALLDDDGPERVAEVLTTMSGDELADTLVAALYVARDVLVAQTAAHIETTGSAIDAPGLTYLARTITQREVSPE